MVVRSLTQPRRSGNSVRGNVQNSYRKARQSFLLDWTKVAQLGKISPYDTFALTTENQNIVLHFAELFKGARGKGSRFSLLKLFSFISLTHL